MVLDKQCSKFTKSGSIVSFLDGIFVECYSYKSRKFVAADFMNKGSCRNMRRGGKV